MIHATAAALTLLALSTASAGSGLPAGRGAGAIEPPPCTITDLSRYREFTPTLPATPVAGFEVDIPTDDGILTLQLSKHTNRSDRFRLLVDRGNGALEPTAPPEIRTYRGTVQGRPDTVASGSLLPTGFSGIIRLEDGKTWAVQPRSDFCAGDRQAAVHVSFAAEDVVPTAHGCALGTPGFPIERYQVGGQGGGMEGGVAGTTPSQVEIACETDFEYFQLNGSSVTGTVNDIESIINGVNTIYDRDVNIVHEISVIVVRASSSDPYTQTTIDGRLTEFETKWASAPESGAFRDFAHMFSGFNFSGGTIGLAYLGVVCNSPSNFQYGVVKTRYTTALTSRIALSAHEIGHNWDCTHCDSQGAANCNIMCASAGGCGGISGSNLRLNTLSINEATAHLNAVGCDFPRPAAQSLPFSESFATTVLATARWTYNDGGIITSLAPAEPSAPNSIQLNSTGPNAYDDDELRTNFLLLSGTANPTLTYWVWRSGVEAGKSLTVEYMTNGQDWIALNTIVSDGASQSGFARFVHTIPAAGRHNQARIRFRVDGADTTDTWYVDDVSIVDSTPTNDECSGAIAVSDGATAFDTTTATGSAVTIPSSCAADGGTSMVRDLWYRYSPTCTGTATVSTCGAASFDTRLAVYPGSSCPSSATPVLACNDNDATCTGGSSKLTFAATAGASYYIRLGGASTGAPGTLTVGCSAPCVGDFDASGTINGDDLGVLLTAWGTSGGPTDLTNDGLTNGDDLGVLLTRWGACGG